MDRLIYIEKNFIVKGIELLSKEIVIILLFLFYLWVYSIYFSWCVLMIFVIIIEYMICSYSGYDCVLIKFYV